MLFRSRVRRTAARPDHLGHLVSRLPRVDASWGRSGWVVSSAYIPGAWTMVALFAAAVVHASLMNRAERQIRVGAVDPTGLPLLTLERLTFRFVNLGFALLTATLLADWLFGEQLYGPDKALRFDHKTVLALMAWFVFLVLIWGRNRRGWRGALAVRTLYGGALCLFLSYAGSRFVTEVLLGRVA